MQHEGNEVDRPQPQIGDLSVDRVAQLVAKRLRGALTDRDRRAVVSRAGITRSELKRLLSAEPPTNLWAIARLEAILGVDLWPGPH